MSLVFNIAGATVCAGKILVDAGGTTADGRFTVLPIPCLGTCDHAPALLIDGDIRRVRVDWAAGGLHKGFKTALDAVWPQITAKLGPPSAQRSEIWLTETPIIAGPIR